MQIPCDELPTLVAYPIPQAYPITHSPYIGAYWYWALIGTLVIIWEITAIIAQHHGKYIPTLSQAVQRGAKWFKWVMAAGLMLLFVHLFAFEEKTK